MNSPNELRAVSDKIGEFAAQPQHTLHPFQDDDLFLLYSRCKRAAQLIELELGERVEHRRQEPETYGFPRRSTANRRIE